MACLLLQNYAICCKETLIEKENIIQYSLASPLNLSFSEYSLTTRPQLTGVDIEVNLRHTKNVLVDIQNCF